MFVFIAHTNRTQTQNNLIRDWSMKKVQSKLHIYVVKKLNVTGR